VAVRFDSDPAFSHQAKKICILHTPHLKECFFAATLRGAQSFGSKPHRARCRWISDKDRIAAPSHQANDMRRSTASFHLTYTVEGFTEDERGSAFNRSEKISTWLTSSSGTYSAGI